jgi:hypothetical protein
MPYSRMLVMISRVVYNHPEPMIVPSHSNQLSSILLLLSPDHLHWHSGRCWIGRCLMFDTQDERESGFSDTLTRNMDVECSGNCIHAVCHACIYVSPSVTLTPSSYSCSQTSTPP